MIEIAKSIPKHRNTLFAFWWTFLFFSLVGVAFSGGSAFTMPWGGMYLLRKVLHTHRKTYQEDEDGMRLGHPHPYNSERGEYPG